MKKPLTKGNLTYLICLSGGFMFYAAATILCSSIPFSFDHVYLVSYLADHIYNSNFQSFIVEQEFDTAHPPLASFLHALIWGIFGKSLVVSHWLQFIFTCLAYYLFIGIASKFISQTQLFIPAVLFIAFPVILAQTIYLSADVLLTCFLLGAIYNYLYQNKIWTFVFISLVLLTSVRGIPIVAAFFLAIQFSNYKNINTTIRDISYFILASIPWALWNLYHYNQAGWMIDNTSSIWSEHRNPNSIVGLLLQSGAFLFRLSEFGFIFIWLILLRHGKTYFAQVEIRFITSLLFTLLFFFIVVTIPFSNPVSTRYLIPIFIIAILLLSIYIVKKNTLIRNIAFTFFSILFFSSHFIIYPERFIKAAGYSWDCTLLSIPYFTKLEPAVQHFIHSNNSKSSSSLITGGMPLYQSSQFTELSIYNKNEVQQPDADNKLSGDYFIYSNIMNDITWEQKLELTDKWELMFEKKAGNIYIQVFKNLHVAP